MYFFLRIYYNITFKFVNRFLKNFSYFFYYVTDLLDFSFKMYYNI